MGKRFLPFLCASSNNLCCSDILNCFDSLLNIPFNILSSIFAAVWCCFSILVESYTYHDGTSFLADWWTEKVGAVHCTLLLTFQWLHYRQRTRTLRCNQYHILRVEGFVFSVYYFGIFWKMFKKQKQTNKNSVTKELLWYPWDPKLWWLQD